jgi:hypothetical protein
MTGINRTTTLYQIENGAFFKKQALVDLWDSRSCKIAYPL